MTRSVTIGLSFLACMAGMVIASSPVPSDSFDGPAELPRVLIKSSVADTPAPGRVRMVKQGDNLQQAINDASCGDTLKLQAGAVFQGLIQIPAKVLR